METPSQKSRSGKSCRLRWLNYLRADIKRGNITYDEEDLSNKLQKLLENSSEAQIRAKSWHVMGTGTRCGSGASIVTISSGNKWMLAEIGRHGVDTAKYETYHFWLFFSPLFPPLETRCPKLPSSSQSFPLSCVRFALSLTPSSSFFNLQS